MQFCLNKIKMTDFPGQNHLPKGDNKHVRPGNILKHGNMGQASLFFGIFGIRGTRAGLQGIAAARTRAGLQGIAAARTRAGSQGIAAARVRVRSRGIAQLRATGACNND